MKPQRSPLLYAGVFLLGLAAARCTSRSDSVCESVGNCEQAGSHDWIQTCEDEADSLRAEAAYGGCAGAFDDYYTCADSKFTCTGVTATFPGCDEQRAALDSCIEAMQKGSSCAALTAAEAACAPVATVDAGPDAAVPPACDLARDCEARCYLGNVANACAPTVVELGAVTTCTSTCPL
ncbi:MAG TPA: hypothetical protein VGI39_16340 [Polyangiaceae bacterium]|jgi:hypothetical protein